MALEYVGGTSGSGTGTTYNISLLSLTGGIASAPAADDLVVVVTGWAWTADVNPGVTTAGYVEVYDLHTNDTRDAEVAVAYKVMGGTPDASVTVSGSGNVANGGATVIHVWRGADTTTPIDVTPPTGVGGSNSSNPNSPAITPVTTDAIVLSVGLCTGDTTPLTKTAPTGYINAVSVAGTGSTMSAIACIASKVWTGGPEDPAAWTGGETSTSDSWAAGTLAIRPAATGFTLVVDPGSFSMVGTTTNILYARSLPVESVEFTLSAPETSLLNNRSLPATSDAFIFTGLDVTFQKLILLAASLGEFNLIGTTAEVKASRQLVCDSASFNLAGISIKALLDMFPAGSDNTSSSTIIND